MQINKSQVWCTRRVLLLGAGTLALTLASSPLPAPADEPAPDPHVHFALLTQEGHPLSDTDLLGQHVLLFFGYTSCPDVCPTSLQTLSAVMDTLGQQAGNVQPVFVTVDPERDTPPVLAAYLSNFHPRLIGLTGPREMIDHLADGYHVKHERVPVPGRPDEYSIDHTAAIFHVGPDGAYIERLSPSLSAEQIAAALRVQLTSE